MRDVPPVMQCLERTAGGRMDHDALLLAMARQVLGGPGDDGCSSYQISLHVCSERGRGEQVASGERVAVPERAANENAAPPVQGAGQPAGSNDDDVDASTAGRSSSHAHTGATKDVQIDTRSDVASTTVTAAPAAPAPAATSSPQTSGAPAPTTGRVLPRARQSLAPALRRAVLERDSAPLPGAGLHPLDVRGRAPHSAAR